MVTGTHGRSDRAVLGGKPLAAQTVQGEGTVPGGAQGLALRRGPSPVVSVPHPDLHAPFFCMLLLRPQSGGQW